MKVFFTTLLGLLFCITLSAQHANFWKDAVERDLQLPANAEREIIPQKYRSVALDINNLRNVLAAAPMERTSAAQNNPLIINIPMPDGEMETFAVWESPVMAPKLAAKYSMIKTYAGKSLRNPSDQIRFGYSPKGFHATIEASSGTIYIDPYATLQDEYYISYYTKDHVDQARKDAFSCGVDHDEHVEYLAEIEYAKKQYMHEQESVSRSGSAAVDLREYTMALACTAEYANRHGGTLTSVMSEMTTLLNRVNGIMRREMGIHFNLVEGNDMLIFFDTATDGYTHGNVSQLFQQNPTVINQVISPADYDIGHVVGVATAGGTVGLAALGSVCNPNRKANGVSTIFNPIGDNFYVDILSHELGHQLGGPHTFNHCDMDNENPSTAFEPGSGSTIMSYSGSCGVNNLQFDSDDYFNIGALELMKLYMHEGDGNTCATHIATNNNTPVVEIPLEDGFYIPINTPFEMPAIGSDEDGDNILYCWEQYNLGPLIDVGDATIGDPPIIRSYPPTPESDKVVPRMINLLNNTTTFGENLPGYGRNMTFRVTVRDHNSEAGACHWDEVRFKVDGDTEPFRVFHPNSDLVEWEVGAYEEVRWNVGGSDGGLVSSPLVNITLSLDGGMTYPVMLAANTPNDGSEFITIPDNITADARVKIKSSNNIFFDISNEDFDIVPPSAPGYSLTASPLTGQVCLPSSFEVDLTTTSLLDYDSLIEFSVISGLPMGATTSYDVNPTLPTDGAKLTFDMMNVTEEGVYDVVIQAIAPSADTSFRTIQLTTVSNDFSALALTMPVDGMMGESTLPTFNWALVPDADTYMIEIATDAAFTDIVDMSAGLTTDAYSPGITLEEGTIYYWRVTPINECGNGMPTAAFLFETVSLVCAGNPSVDTPIAISSSGTPSTESKLNITASGVISDVNITSIQGNHEWFSDLTLTLVSPIGTEAVLFTGRCLNYNGPMSFGIDDQAPNTFQCPPSGGGSFKPAQPLSIFNGEDTAGEWKLRIEDANGGNGGQITSWNIEFCGNLMVSTDDLEDANRINIFPNPVNEIVNIEFENDVTNPVEVRLVDVTGRILKVIQQDDANNVISMNTKSLASGIYFLHIKVGDQFVTEKFSKQ